MCSRLEPASLRPISCTLFTSTLLLHPLHAPFLLHLSFCNPPPAPLLLYPTQSLYSCRSFQRDGGTAWGTQGAVSEAEVHSPLPSPRARWREGGEETREKEPGCIIGRNDKDMKENSQGLGQDWAKHWSALSFSVDS